MISGGPNWSSKSRTEPITRSSLLENSFIPNKTAYLISTTMLRGGFMSKSRRQFLTRTSLGLVAAAVVPVIPAADMNVDSQQPTQPPPGAPPAFGTGPAVGPEVSPATFAEAEKLEQVQLSGA